MWPLPTCKLLRPSLLLSLLLCFLWPLFASPSLPSPSVAPRKGCEQDKNIGAGQCPPLGSETAAARHLPPSLAVRKTVTPCTPLSIYWVVQWGWRGGVGKLTVSPTATPAPRECSGQSWSGQACPAARRLGGCCWAVPERPLVQVHAAQRGRHRPEPHHRGDQRQRPGHGICSQATMAVIRGGWRRVNRAWPKAGAEERALEKRGRESAAG